MFTIFTVFSLSFRYWNSLFKAPTSAFLCQTTYRTAFLFVLRNYDTKFQAYSLEMGMIPKMKAEKLKILFVCEDLKCMVLAKNLSQEYQKHAVITSLAG